MTGVAVQPPLIVQSDRTLLLEVDNPAYAECRDRLAAFAELTKSPEHFHTYTVTPLSLWNAASAGRSATSRRSARSATSSSAAGTAGLIARGAVTSPCSTARATSAA